MYKTEYNTEAQTEFVKNLRETVETIVELLIRKNRAYGDSAMNPVRIFSKSTPLEQLKVRIDDKLSRLAYGRQDEIKEDVVDDLIGYLLIFKMQNDKAAKELQKMMQLPRD